MKTKRLQTTTDHQATGQWASCAQNVAARQPTFVIRLPLPMKLGSDVKSRQTVFEKTVNGQRFRVVQTVVAHCQAKTKAASRILARRLADWPSIPPVVQPKQWVH